MRWIRLAVGCAYTMMALAAGSSADFKGKVIEAHDGDTVRIQCLSDPQRTQVVRLKHVDTPEFASAQWFYRGDQPFAVAARDFIRELLKPGELVNVTERGEGCLGKRVCGSVSTSETPDVSKAVVEAGLGWADRCYEPDNRFVAAENAARAAGLGLWSDSKAIAPWHWRHGLAWVCNPRKRKTQVACK